jgi:hypothetical protein
VKTSEALSACRNVSLKTDIQKETTKMFLRKNGFLTNRRHEKMDSRLRGNDERGGRE